MLLGDKESSESNSVVFFFFLWEWLFFQGCHFDPKDIEIYLNALIKFVVLATTASETLFVKLTCIYISIFSETIITLLIDTPDLNKDQLADAQAMFSGLVETYVEGRDHPTDKVKGLKALAEFAAKIYKAYIKHADVGSLIIILNCQTIESLEHLWSDYLFGHLDKVAERYLVTLIKWQSGTL